MFSSNATQTYRPTSINSSLVREYLKNGYDFKKQRAINQVIRFSAKIVDIGKKKEFHCLLLALNLVLRKHARLRQHSSILNLTT